MIAIVSVFPLGKGESMGALVAEAIEEADKSGLDYRLTAMGTILEGEWDTVFKLIKRMRDRVAKKSPRVYLTIAVDDRKDKPARRHLPAGQAGAGAGRIESKIKSVENALSKPLRK